MTLERWLAAYRFLIGAIGQGALIYAVATMAYLFPAHPYRAGGVVVCLFLALELKSFERETRNK